MLILELLRYDGGPPSPIAADKVASMLQTAKRRELQWALDAGLGPLLYEVTRTANDPVPTALGEVLLSADLTARVLNENRVEAAEEIIAACAAIGVPVTLLKGISISEQHYPSPHHRAMSDIDVLVHEDALSAVQVEACRLGYMQRGPRVTGPGSHHAEPLYHANRQTELEIHTGLFPRYSRLSTGNLFGPANIARESAASTFRGREVCRLSDVLQLVYVGCYWARDLSRLSVHLSFVPPLLDIVEILSNRQGTFDWEHLFGLLDNERAIACLYLVLSYLDRRELARLPPAILPWLATHQRNVGAGELRAIHAVVDKFLIVGRPFFKPLSTSHVWENLLAPEPYMVKLVSLPSLPARKCEARGG